MTNKIVKILRNKKKLPEEKIPVPALSALHLFPVRAYHTFTSDVFNRSPTSTEWGFAYDGEGSRWYTVRCPELLQAGLNPLPLCSGARVDAYP